MRAEPCEALVQCTPAGESRQFVAERHAKGVLQHADRQYQRPRSEEGPEHVGRGDAVRGYPERDRRAGKCEVDRRARAVPRDACDQRAQYDRREADLRHRRRAPWRVADERGVEPLTRRGVPGERSPRRHRCLQRNDGETQETVAVERAAFPDEAQCRQVERHEQAQRAEDCEHDVLGDRGLQIAAVRRVGDREREQCEYHPAAPERKAHDPRQRENAVGCMDAECSERCRQFGQAWNDEIRGDQDHAWDCDAQ